MKIKTAALAFATVTLGIFALLVTKNAPPSDFRDAVAEDLKSQDFKTTLPKIENSANLPAPSAAADNNAQSRVDVKLGYVMQSGSDIFSAEGTTPAIAIRGVKENDLKYTLSVAIDGKPHQYKVREIIAVNGNAECKLVGMGEDILLKLRRTGADVFDITGNVKSDVFDPAHKLTFTYVKHGQSKISGRDMEFTIENSSITGTASSTLSKETLAAVISLALGYYHITIDREIVNMRVTATNEYFEALDEKIGIQLSGSRFTSGLYQVYERLDGVENQDPINVYMKEYHRYNITQDDISLSLTQRNREFLISGTIRKDKDDKNPENINITLMQGEAPDTYKIMSSGLLVEIDPAKSITGELDFKVLSKKAVASVLSIALSMHASIIKPNSPF